MEEQTGTQVNLSPSQAHLPVGGPRRRGENRWLALFDRLTPHDQHEIVLLARLKLQIKVLSLADDDPSAADQS